MGGVYVMPADQGGTNWYPQSYSPQTGLFYLSVWENYGAVEEKQPFKPYVQGELYNGASWWPGLAEHDPPKDLPPAVPAPAGPNLLVYGNPNYKVESEGYGAIRGIDPKTGEKKWEFKMVAFTECGVLSTAGGLVFGGGMDGDFMALDAETGRALWHAYLGGANTSGPMTYAVDGKQYIVGTGAGVMFAFALPD